VRVNQFNQLSILASRVALFCCSHISCDRSRSVGGARSAWGTVTDRTHRERMKAIRHSDEYKNNHSIAVYLGAVIDGVRCTR
jgi:hypothetical protein